MNMFIILFAWKLCGNTWKKKRTLWCEKVSQNQGAFTPRRYSLLFIVSTHCSFVVCCFKCLNSLNQNGLFPIDMVLLYCVVKRYGENSFFSEYWSLLLNNAVQLHKLIGLAVGTAWTYGDAVYLCEPIGAHPAKLSPPDWAGHLPIKLAHSS